MPANTMTVEHDDLGGLFGRSFVRLTVAALLAVLVLGAIANAASARTATTTMSQNDFVSQCRAGGGTSKRLGTHVVQCTTGGGQVVTCDFNTSPASCIIASMGGPRFPIDAVITDGVLVEAEPAPSGPGVRPGQVLITNAVLVEAEAAPAAPGTTVTSVGNVEAIDPIAPIATEESPAPVATDSHVAPATTEVVAAEPVVVEFVEDEQR